MEIESPQSRRTNYRRVESTFLANINPASSSFGKIDWLDEVGGTQHSWRIDTENVTIGSGNGCSIILHASGLEPVHGAVTFGKNHILVQAIEGAVLVSGRQIREWLLDEPTVILFGTVRLRITPSAYLQKSEYAPYQLTPGSVTDQAARLQSHSLSGLAEPEPGDTSHAETSLAEPNEQSPLPAKEARGVEIPSVEHFERLEVAKDIKAAIDPLRDSLDSIRISVVEGLRELSASLSDHYEQRFQDTSAVIDNRFERLESLLASTVHHPRHDVGRDDNTKRGFAGAREIQLPGQQLANENYSFSNESELESRVTESTTEDILRDEDYSEYEHQPESSVDHSPFGFPLSSEGLLATSFEGSSYQESYTEEPSEELPATQHDGNADVTQLYAGTEFDSSVEPINSYSDYQSQTSYEEEVAPFYDGSEYHDTRFAVEETGDRESSSESKQDDLYSVQSTPSDPELPAWFTARDTHSLENDEVPGHSTLVDSHRRLDQDEDYSAYEDNSAAEPRFEDIGIEAPTITDERYSDQLERDNSYTQMTPSQAAELVQAESFQSGTAVGQLEGGEEESIEVYMQRLLQRMKGETSSEEFVSPSNSNRTTGANATTTVRMKPSALENEPPTTSPGKYPIPKNEYVRDPSSEAISGVPHHVASDSQPVFVRTQPRISVEEQQQSLTALRELANHTARKAINQNTKKRTEGVFFSKLLISVSGFVGGSILMIINGFTPNVSMAGMICGYAVFLLWGYDAWCHSQRLLVAKREDEVEDE